MDRSLIVHGKYAEAQDKFDYFVLTLIVAVCAYLTQNTQFGPLGVNAGTVYLLSLSVFACAAFFGFKRIEFMIVSYRLNSTYLDSIEKARHDEAAHISSGMEIIRKKVARYYNLRNFFFLLGFIIFIAAKIFDAYSN